MTSSPVSTRPAPEPWYASFLLDRSRSFRASLALLIGLAMACSLGAANFGLLQSALALAALLAASTSLGLDSLVRERLTLRPLETASTLGTGMALRCGAGLIAYTLMVILTSSSPAAPRSVWLVAALLVLTQTPLLVGLRFEGPVHQRRALLAHNVALALSAAIVGLLIWTGADPVWFAAAIVLEQPLAGLFLLFGHDRVAPEEETFHWEWPAAIEWLKRCRKPLGATLLALALLPLSQLLVFWRSTAANAGYFAVAAVLFEFGAFWSATVILGRLTRSRTTPDEVPLAPDSAAAVEFNRAASMGWILALAVAAVSALLAFTLFRQGAVSLTLTGAFLGLSLVPLSLGIVRDEYWHREGGADRVLLGRLLAVGLNLVLTWLLAPVGGATGAAAATCFALLAGEVVLTLFPGHAPKLAPAQASALLLRHLWHREKAAPPRPAPLPPVAEADATRFIGNLLPASLNSSDSVASAAAAVKSP